MGPGRDPPAPRVLLVDDEPLFALSLTELLKERCATTVATTLGEAEALIPQVAWAGMMIDVSLRGRDGTQLLPLARRHHPQIPIVLMTGGDRSVCGAAYDHDAAFAPKPLPWGYTDRFCTLVHAQTSDQKLAIKLSQLSLTQAEVAVIVELAKGKSAKAVAAQLHVAAATVRNHAASARARLGVSNMLQLLRLVGHYP